MPTKKSTRSHTRRERGLRVSRDDTAPEQAEQERADGRSQSSESGQVAEAEDRLKPSRRRRPGRREGIAITLGARRDEEGDPLAHADDSIVNRRHEVDNRRDWEP